jgi:quinol monooxygenase YgiN
MIVIAKLQAKSGKAEELEKAFKDFIPKVQSEAGCLIYELHRDHKDPSIFITYEKYMDKDALNNHAATPHVQEFLPILLPLVEGQPSLEVYDEVAGIAK